MKFIGTSAHRALLLAATSSYQSPQSRERAVSDAVAHAAEDDSHPVLIAVDAGSPRALVILSGDGTTTRERLGFTETAALNDVVKSLLDGLDRARSALRGVAKPDGSPSRDELVRAYRAVKPSVVLNRLRVFKREYVNAVNRLRGDVKKSAPVTKREKPKSGEGWGQNYGLASQVDGLGIPVTAGFGDLINGLVNVLDETHKTVRNILDVGQGGNAEIPSIKDAYEYMHDKVVDHNSKKKKTKKSKPPKQAKDPNAQKALPKPKKIKQGAAGAGEPKHPQHDDAVSALKNLGHKHADADAAVSTATKKLGVKAPLNNLIKEAISSTRKPDKNDQNAKPSDGKDAKKPGTAVTTTKPAASKDGSKIASKDVKVSGKFNGKAATTTVHKGTSYRLVKVQGGTQLIRKGGRGTFILDAGDVGKLK